MRKLLMGILLIFCASFFLFLFWQPPIKVNLIVETSDYSNIDIKFKFDNEVIFFDSVAAGTYSRKAFKLEKVPMGFHKFETISVLGNAQYSEKLFLLFDRTIIIEYFKGGKIKDSSYFRIRTMNRDFYPD